MARLRSLCACVVATDKKSAAGACGRPSPGRCPTWREACRKQCAPLIYCDLVVLVSHSHARGVMGPAAERQVADSPDAAAPLLFLSVYVDWESLPARRRGGHLELQIRAEHAAPQKCAAGADDPLQAFLKIYYWISLHWLRRRVL